MHSISRRRRSCLLRVAAVYALCSLGFAEGYTHSPVDMTVNPAVAPYAGHVNHAHLAPTFRWGWFGAERYHPRVAWHRDYNGELVRWATHRRY